MRIVYPVLFALVLLGLLVPVASAADAPEILFSANPKNVQIVKSGKALRLVMPAATRTTWFTDRPERKAGSTNLRRLAATWTAMGFTTDPPNAALILSHKSQTRTHVVTLTRPRITRGRVSFRIRAIPNIDEAGHRHTDPLRPGRYASAELFIDDTAIPPCSTQMTGSATCIAAAGMGINYTPGSAPGSLAVCAMTNQSGYFVYPIMWSVVIDGRGRSGVEFTSKCTSAGPQSIGSVVADTSYWFTNFSGFPMTYEFSVD